MEIYSSNRYRLRTIRNDLTTPQVHITVRVTEIKESTRKKTATITCGTYEWYYDIPSLGRYIRMKLDLVLSAWNKKKGEYDKLYIPYSELIRIFNEEEEELEIELTLSIQEYQYLAEAIQNIGTNSIPHRSLLSKLGFNKEKWSEIANFANTQGLHKIANALVFQAPNSLELTRKIIMQFLQESTIEDIRKIADLLDKTESIYAGSN